MAPTSPTGETTPREIACERCARHLVTAVVAGKAPLVGVCVDDQAATTKCWACRHRNKPCVPVAGAEVALRALTAGTATRGQAVEVRKAFATKTAAGRAPATTTTITTTAPAPAAASASAASPATSGEVAVMTQLLRRQNKLLRRIAANTAIMADNAAEYVPAEDEDDDEDEDEDDKDDEDDEVAGAAINEDGEEDEDDE